MVSAWLQELLSFCCPNGSHEIVELDSLLCCWFGIVQLGDWYS